MNYALVSPCDLSTKIFNKGFSKILSKDAGNKVYTIGPVTWGYVEEIESAGSRHIPIKMSRFINPISDILYILRLAWILKTKKVDILITWTTKPNLYGPFAGLIAGVPVRICAIRGLGRIFSNPNRISEKLLQWVVEELYRFSSGLSDLVWFTNPNDLSYFLERKIVDENKTLLTKNGIDMSFYSMNAVNQSIITETRKELGLKDGEKAVLMIGRMIWPKGVEDFILASEIVHKKMNNVKFILVAPFEKSSPLGIPREYLDEKLKNGTFIYRDFIKDIRGVYAVCDISVLPSYYKEGGYPRALLEAMSFGKPVITTDTPGCRGAVDDGKNGFLVPAKDPEKLAEAVMKILSDSQTAEKFGAHSIEKVKAEFDENIFIRKVLEKLENITNANNIRQSGI
ncbi:MAG: glycosyltransferase family 4 protein [Nitrospinota bacterium]|nr:glycosyltransferase family 4 protein [Nitrospinota bacterium]